MTQHNEASLLDALGALGVAHTYHVHGAVFTVEESAQLHADITGAHTKNLFLKDAGGQFWLVTVPADIRVDLKALPAAISAKRVSFGKAEDMERLLGVIPGAVTPLAAINDTAGAVNIVIENSLAAATCVNVHPLHNCATVGLSGVDLVKALASWGHDPLICDIPKLD